MNHIQCERLPKCKMASSDDRLTFEIVHVLRFENELTKELCCRFIFTNLQQSLDLATNFQDLVTKVKNLVALAPVLGAILRPGNAIQMENQKEKFVTTYPHLKQKSMPGAFL